MECNKDEALRAKEIAEKKFSVEDFAGAKKFALKAQNLYPGLEGISQMVATFDVYICASNKTNGEADWYSMLGVASTADAETIRKQYRKLILTLHPDKNKSIGAEDAFKNVSEAWSVLSDQSKRKLYDQRRCKPPPPKSAPPPPKSAPTPPKSAPPPAANSFFDFRKSTFSSGEANGKQTVFNFSKSTVSSDRLNGNIRRVSKLSASGTAQKPKLNSFWTVCIKCKMHYEYHIIYLNQSLTCQKCHRPFTAKAAPGPNGSENSSQQQRHSNAKFNSSGGFADGSWAPFSQGGASWNSSQQQRNSNNKSATSGGFADGSWAPFSQGGASWNSSQQQRNSNNKSATSGGFAQFADDSRAPFSQGGASKKEREEALAAKGQDKDIKRKRPSSEKSFTEYFSFANKRRDIEEAGLSSINQNPPGIGVSISSVPFRHGFTGASATKLHGAKNLSLIQIRAILVERARSVIGKKISVEKPNSISKMATPSDKAGSKADSGSDYPEVLNQEKSETSIGKRNVDPSNDVSAVAANEPNKSTSESQAIDVPDSDFYDFDKDRNEESFKVNQLWAAYDTDDGMPRFYAYVQSVQSRHPFKVRISWLEPKTNSGSDSRVWVDSGFSQSCGEFRISRSELNDSLNSFSHIVRLFTKRPRGVIQMYPKKGDVWALYRNWSPDWNEETPKDVVYKYDMVEVLADYDEEEGVDVTPLVKVSGFKTVFRQPSEGNQTRRIPKEEIFRFSHQVPRHLLTDQEASDTLKGCIELDPAAASMD